MRSTGATFGDVVFEMKGFKSQDAVHSFSFTENLIAFYLGGY